MSSFMLWPNISYYLNTLLAELQKPSIKNYTLQILICTLKV